jgi:YD repeat-containing protein
MRISRGRRGIRSIFGWLAAAALALAATAGLAAEQRYVYDELGRLIAVIDPAGETTHYTYDEAGNLTSVSRASSAQVAIVSFAPTRGRWGDVVNIFGSGFSATPGQNAVTFNGTPAAVTASTTTSITAVVPTGAASGPIQVTTPQGSATSAQPFVVIVPQPPAIGGFTPSVVTPNASVVVSGAAFEPVPADNQARVNTSTAVAIAATEDSLTLRAPNATGGKISVATPNGSATSADDLFIVPAPNAAGDVAATARLVIDGTGAALALPAGKIGLALFDGTAGAVGVKVSVRDATISSGTLTVYAPNGTTLASTSFGTAGTTLSLPTLPATGSYGVRITSNGGNATVAVWRDFTATLAYGVPVDLTFTNPGQQARLTFTAAAGDFAGIDVSAVTMSGGSVTVLMPNGSTWDSFSFTAAGAGRRFGPLNTAGDWTIVVTPSASATGSLRLTLWKDVAGTLAVGALNDLAVTYPAQFLRLTFTGTAGQFAGLDLSDVQGMTGGAVTVLAPNGGTWDSFSFTSPSGAGRRFGPLNANGTWTVVVAPAASSTGTLKLRLWNDVADTLSYDVPYALSIPNRSQHARLGFTGTVGDFAGVELSAVAFPSGGSVTIVAPNGTTWDSFSFASGTGASRRFGPLNTTGTWTVVVVPAAGSTGSAQVKLWKDVADTLAYHTPYTLAISHAAQQARLTFAGAVGDFAGLDVSAVAFPSGGAVTILAPNGTTWDSFSFGTGGASRRFGPLNAAGNWTVVVVPASAATGSAQLTLWKDVPGTLAVGALTDVTVAFASQQVRLTFAGTAGQFAGLDVSDVQGMTGGSVTILAPNGTTWDSFSFTSPSGAGRRFGPLNATGNWTVIVVPASGATGTLKLRLWNDVADTLTYHSPYALSIPNRSQQARLTFVAAFGDLAGLEVSAVAFPSGGAVTILAPNGTTWDSFTFGAGGASRRFGPLNAAGNWTVVVVPASAATGSAQFTLWKDVPGTLALGVLTDVTVAFPAQQVRMTFAGTAGQFAGLDLSDVQGMSGGTVTILAPNGTTWDSFSFTSPSGAGRRFGPLNAGGNWSVVVVPNSAATGSFKARLWNDVTDALTIGAPYALAIGNRSQQARLRFEAVAGQTATVSLSGVTLPSGSTVQVFLPSGSAQTGANSFGSAGISFGTGALSQSGTYTVHIVPAASGTGSASVLVSTP